MLPYLQKCEPPDADPRWRAVAATMRKLGNQRHGLIEALHTLQQQFGYLTPRGLTFIAGTLRIPLSQVYGTATFYNLFTLHPPSKHSCVVCTGTACYIKGSGGLIEAAKAVADESLAISTARCFGACGLAPMALIDEQPANFLTPDKLREELREAVHHATR